MKGKLSPVAVVFFLFLAVCGVSMAVSLCRKDNDFLEREKRYKNELPEFSAGTLLDGTFLKETEEKWLPDRFPFRDFWVGVNAYWTLLEGRNAQRDVYLAKDGYLINDPEAFDTERFTENLRNFEAFAQQTGLPAKLLAVPASGYVNKDRLPLGHGTYHDGELFALAAETLETVELIDVREALSEGNRTADMFYRTDHHLTARGNYVLYQRWCEAVGLEPLPESAFTVESHDGFYGTTWSASGYWLTKPDTVELWDSGAEVEVTISDGKRVKTSDSLFFREHLQELDQYPVYLDGNHALVRIENPSAERGTLLIVKDSYAHCFATFAANEYRTVYMVDLRYYRDGFLSDFAAEQGVDEILYLYGVDNLLTDSNSGWLM